MIIKLILAADINGGIGNNGKLPWHIPEELKFFKKQTLNHSVIMGRKTYEGLKEPLKKRKNYILTKDPSFKSFKATELKNDVSIEYVMNYFKNSKETLFVIGGGYTYLSLKGYAEEVILTKIGKAYECDRHLNLKLLLKGFSHDKSKDVVIKNSQNLDIVATFHSRD